MTAPVRPTLRLPGRVWEWFAERAERQLDAGVDVDVCDALSRPGFKRRGGGHTIYLFLTAGQVRRLAGWVLESDPKRIRDYAAAALQAADAIERRERDGGAAA